MKIDRQHSACLLSEDWNHDRISITRLTVKKSGHFDNAQIKIDKLNSFHERISKNKMLSCSCSEFIQAAMQREKTFPLLLNDLVARLGAVETTVNEMKNIVRLVVCDLNEKINELECLQDERSTNGTARCNFSIDEDN